MKINVLRIVSDHLLTLRDTRSGKLSATDVVIFYIAPVVAGAVSYWLDVSLKTDFYNVSVTFFGIFIALMLNIQVALYSIFLRKWEIKADKRSNSIQKDQIITRNLLLNEVNTNVSYLTLICCVCLFSTLIMFALSHAGRHSSAIAVLLYMHFLLTLLMVVKRFYIVFRFEYENPIGEVD